MNAAEWTGFRAALDHHAPATGEWVARRLEVCRDGALLAQLRAGAQPLWVRWDGERIESLTPAGDHKLPLSALLRESGPGAGLEVLNWRPGRRLVLLDSRNRIPLIIKGYRKGHAAVAFTRYDAAYRALRGNGVAAPEAIDLDAKYESIVLAHHSGVPLDVSLDSIDVFHRIGECLAAIQGRAADFEITTFVSGDELGVIDRFSEKVLAAGLELPRKCEILRDRLGELEPMLPEMVAGLCHRDLHDRQFKLNADHLTLLDFDLLCRADVALDAANLLAHLALRQFQGMLGATPASVERCGKQFLEGLGRNEEPGFWERLRFYQASSFCRLALVYTLRPPWVSLAPTLVQMGQRCVDDLQRIDGR